MQVVAHPPLPARQAVCGSTVWTKGQYVACTCSPGHDPAGGHEGTRADGATIRWSED